MANKPRVDWQKILSDYRSSDEPVGSFCRQRNIKTSTFYYWLAKEGEAQDPVKLLPVVDAKPHEPDFVELILPKEKRLRFSPGASPIYVTSIVKALV